MAYAVIQSALIHDSEMQLWIKMLKLADCREYPLCSAEDRAEPNANYRKVFECNLHIQKAILIIILHNFIYSL